ncbi:competence protein CoiA [Variovorax saccharolyticus]|uniref:competence protein CoiA n=1 Tax=Variovorax saccharolyticus TaxID=3053516 RepID=UPI002575D3A7|nr:competence protein CoiA family protein [Variovorax sp. J22R187]MDM0020046.1 competence protein CoiA family protein [Variovorax sp. J22R187]
MLTALRTSDNGKVLARSSAKADSPFMCPACNREVVLHKGLIRIHHFAHKARVACRLGAGESEDHLLTKLSLFDALRTEPNAQDVELEKRFGNCVGDVFAIISGVPVAIEIQRSALAVREITDRTEHYHRLGIAVLWIGIPNGDLGLSRYSPAAWERWCHAAYFGRVYCWSGGQTLRPVHYAPFALRVEESSWRKNGQVHSSGGYDRRSRRWRKPQPGQPVLVSNGFRRTPRQAWTGGSVHVPECTLFIDRQPNWWDQ